MSISNILKNPLIWIFGVILAVLSSWLSGVLEEFLPNPGEIRQCIECAFEDDLPPSHDRFRFVVSRLESDDNPERSQDIFNRAFNGIPGVELLASRCIVKASAVGPIAIGEQQKRAQLILKRLNADVLIFGMFYNGSNVRHLSLAFVPRQEDGGGVRGSSPGTQLYTLNAPSLGEEFKEDIRAWIVSRALATAASAADQATRGQLLASALAHEANKIEKLLEESTITEPARLAALRLAHGVVLHTLGEIEKDASWLLRAVHAFSETLKVITRQDQPVTWARTQNRLGGTLRILGSIERDRERLAQAVAARNAALTVFTRESMPLDWARTQNNLGNTLQALGDLENNSQRLTQAVSAHSAALTVFTHDQWPLDWANTQNSLGVAFELLGKRENDATRLEQAVNTYNKALTVFTRDGMPLYWARTQNNLGRILQILGKKKSDTERLEQAVNAYRKALTVFARADMSLDWARTQNNLGNTLQYLGQLEDNMERLEEAVSAYNKALTVFKLDHMPQYRAKTKDNLDRALQALGRRENHTE